MKIVCAWIILWAAAISLVGATAGGNALAAETNTVDAKLNGLTLVFDSDSGTLVEMSYPGVGKMIDTSADKAGIIDLAYPTKAFEPLRLAARYSKGAKIEKTVDSVTVTWDGLGRSRAFDVPGRVSAKMVLRAADDGRSIIATCEIENSSDTDVRQVLFPDFDGIVPFAGETDTSFRSCGFVSTPFKQLKRSDDGIGFYGSDPSIVGIEYMSGGRLNTTPMTVRWFDIGSLKGGLSVFRKAWGWGPDESTVAGEKVWLRLKQEDNRLRMACMHNVTIKKGEKWSSGEYIFTPHTSGWAKGIEPYGKWVKVNCKRVVPMAKHVKEGLGFRTVWMSEQYINDPSGKGIAWRFNDLPKLAEESIAHGIDEITLWSWGPYQIPFFPAHKALGGDEALIAATKACKKIGVNVNLFISLQSLMSPTAEKYGLTPSPAGSWTYNRELIPVFRAEYAPSAWTAGMDQSNQKWQDDILESMKHYIDLGIASFSWDTLSPANVKPNIYDLFGRYQKLARAKDPNSTFSGESCSNMEEDSKYMDYTWDWHYYMDSSDYRPFTSVFPSPRPTTHIDCAPRYVKRAFMDNIYIGVFTSKPDGINGSAHITDYPEFSKALKQCAKLRKQFLPYFTDGRLIGDCVLTESCPGARINGYVLGDKMLVIVLNESNDNIVNFKYDLGPWGKSASGSYDMKCYDLDCKVVSSMLVKAAGSASTGKIKQYDLRIFEFIAK